MQSRSPQLTFEPIRERMVWEQIRMTKTLTRPYISRLSRNEVTPEVGEIFDFFQRERGNVPNMFRRVAHRPEILQTMIAHFQAVVNTGTVPKKLKELIIVRTSQINDCEYCIASHSIICKKLGW